MHCESTPFAIFEPVFFPLEPLAQWMHQHFNLRFRHAFAEKKMFSICILVQSTENNFTTGLCVSVVSQSLFSYYKINGLFVCSHVSERVCVCMCICGVCQEFAFRSILIVQSDSMNAVIALLMWQKYEREHVNTEAI